MRHLSTIQDRPKPITSIFRTSRRGHINSTICSLQHELNHRVTSSGRKRLNLSHGRPRSFKGGNSLPNYQNGHNGRNRRSFTWKPIQMVWITGQDDIWSRTTICGKSIQSNVIQIRGEFSIIYGLSSTNRRNYGTGQPRNRSISGHLLPFPSRNMEKELGDIGIYSQQSKTCRLLQLFTLLYLYFYLSTFIYVIPLISGHESSYLWLVSLSFDSCLLLWLI
jgi:hypothetical protein